MAIQLSRQSWQIGDVVAVGFVKDLEVVKMIPTPGDYAPDAYVLWQAVYEGLRARGVTHERAIEWLQSKGPRHALDGALGDALHALGRSFAATAELPYYDLTP